MSNNFGKLLVFIGIIIIITGVILIFKDNLPFIRNFGKLPGDINIKKDNFSFHFPVVSCIVISIILSIIFYVFNKLR